jgi:hypothetical protein
MGSTSSATGGIDVFLTESELEGNEPQGFYDFVLW